MVTERDKTFTLALLDRLEKHNSADGASLCRLFHLAGLEPSAEIAQNQDAMFDFPHEAGFDLAATTIFSQPEALKYIH